MNNTIITAVIAGAVGLMFVGITQIQKNNASNTANLPATNANVAANAQAIIDLREQLTKAISEAEKTAADSLDSEAQLIRAEINRREPEVLETVTTLNKERSDDIDELRDDIDKMDARLRADITEIRKQEFDHVNTPEASHHDKSH